MENLRGAALMTLAMLGFAVEDMFVKLLAGVFPTWQIIGILGMGGGIVFGALTLLRREVLFPRAALSPTVLVRNLGELIGTVGFVTAIALTPLSSASAILQATPLAVTLGAALFFREPVGWRRWSAILAGFFGVLMIIRPGMDAFDPLSLFAVIAVVGLAVRDLATRNVPRATSSFQLSFLAFMTLIPAATLLSIFSPSGFVMPAASHWGLILGAVVMGVASYYAIVAAMRIGEVSFVTPFRYSRLIFALVIGMLVFRETPDLTMLTGAAIIVGSGIYTLWRERKLRQGRQRSLSLGASQGYEAPKSI
ncbi:DMT family transporter [Sedimentitalea sp. XS_ASV28]|uniref:DMT family transporter n=1 Tax=Sedimentitalea sp. XS_ASV28 TaxID=3241296 RepID=UPI0035127A37